MKLRKKLLLFAALSAFTMFLIGGTPSALADEPGLSLHPAPCTWTVDKTASLHGVPITALNLAKGETVTVDYTIVVTRTCEEGFHPFDEGGSADVVDSYAGTLATHLFLDDLHPFATRTFTYSRDVTAESCDAFDVTNTVDVVDGDPTTPFATDSVTIHVTVHCNGGCTLTQGYWKTHSALGPASKADPTWNLVGGPDATFFFSGQTWYQVFWTPPSGGNVYYQLAHQYMAARLNILNGASAPSSVSSAITAATVYFNTAGNTPASAANLSKSAQRTLQGYASTLASYNEGAIGPGHCDE